MSDYYNYTKELDQKRRRIHVTTSVQDKNKANQEARTHNTEYEDALHFILAKKGNANYLVTQNEPHYACFRDRIKVTQPRFLGMNFLK
ncbi:MAG: hypothetical protein V1859_09465, partial [archaeon]